MIFTRETVPAIIRRGIWVVSRSTPSTRKRTRISRPSGSKWMSEAPSSTAWAMIEFTSLITGASSADSRISVMSAISSSPCSTASATASSSRLMRVITPAMSSGEATTGRTSLPVISFRSSRASTFDGSAMATSSWPFSSYPIGTAPSRRAACALIELRALTSVLKMVRSTWWSPKRWAIARESWSPVIAPDSSRTCSGARPLALPSSMAGSTRSRGRKPICTITSEMKRELPRCWGAVRPVAGPPASGGLSAAALAAPPAGTARNCADPPCFSLIARPRLPGRASRRQRSPRAGEPARRDRRPRSREPG